MQSIQELRERRTSLAQNIRTLLDEHPGDKWNAALQEKYDQGMAEIEAIGAEAKRIQAVLDMLADRSMTDDVRNLVERKTHGNKSETVNLYSK